MDLKDEKKACQLFYGAFSIHEATEFQKAEWSQTGNPWWPLGFCFPVAGIMCSASEQDPLAGNICWAQPCSSPWRGGDESQPRAPQTSILCRGLSALPSEGTQCYCKTPCKQGCFGNCSIWGKLCHIQLLLLMHLMCQITSPSPAQPHNPAW